MNFPLCGGRRTGSTSYRPHLLRGVSRYFFTFAGGDASARYTIPLSRQSPTSTLRSTESAYRPPPRPLQESAHAKKSRSANCKGVPSAPLLPQSPLRQLIAQRSLPSTHEDAPVADDKRDRAQTSPESSVDPPTVDVSTTLFQHPCQFQLWGGCASTGIQPLPKHVPRCPHASLSSVLCLHAVRSGFRGGCLKSLLGVCPWHHGPSPYRQAQLAEALYGRVEDITAEEEGSTSASSSVQGRPLAAALERDATGAAWSLSVVVDAAVVAVGASSLPYVEETMAEQPAHQLTWKGLLAAASTSEGADSFLRVFRVGHEDSDDSTLYLGVEEALLYAAVEGAMERHAARTHTGGRGLQEEMAHWVEGPIVSSFFTRCPAEAVEVSPIKSSSRESYLLLSPLLQEWLVKEVTQWQQHPEGVDTELCPVSLLRRRLRAAIEAVLDQRLNACASPAGGDAADRALCLLRDAVVWSLLRVAGDADDPEAVVMLVAPMVERGTEASAAPLSLLSELLLRMPASNIAEESRHGGVRSSSQIGFKAAWERLHVLVLNLYACLLYHSPEAPASSAQHIVTARLAQLVLPSLVFLCQQHAAVMEQRYYHKLQAGLGWQPWGPAQWDAVGNADPMLYSSWGFVRHHQRHIASALCHSLLHSLLLLTLSSNAEDFQLCRPHEWSRHICLSEDHHRAKKRPGYCMTPHSWSQRDRARVLTPYRQLLFGLLGALTELGEDIRHERVGLCEAYEQQRAARQAEQRSAEAEAVVTGQSRVRRYQEKAWREDKSRLQRQQEYMGVPALDKYFPSGTCVVSGEVTASLLRHFIDGGAPFAALRLAVSVVRSMRLLRRAARTPLASMERRVKRVHRRVPLRKNPFKKVLVQTQVVTHRLVVQGAPNNDAEGEEGSISQASPSSSPALLYDVTEDTVREIVRVGLRMRSAGARLAEGVLRECIKGNVQSFLYASTAEGSRPALRGLWNPSWREIHEYLGQQSWFNKDGSSTHCSATETGVRALLDLLQRAPALPSSSPSSHGAPLIGAIGVQRVPPTPRLLEVALAHTIHERSIFASHGTKSAVEEAANWGQLRCAALGYLLLDVSSLVTAEVLFAVQLGQTRAHPSQALSELCEVMTRCVGQSATEGLVLPRKSGHSAGYAVEAPLWALLKEDVQRLCTMEGQRGMLSSTGALHRTADPCLADVKSLLTGAAPETHTSPVPRSPPDAKALYAAVLQRSFDASPTLRHASSSHIDWWALCASTLLGYPHSEATSSALAPTLLWKWSIALACLMPRSSAAPWLEACTRILLLADWEGEGKWISPLSSGRTPVIQFFPLLCKLQVRVWKVFQNAVPLADQDASSDEEELIRRIWTEECKAFAAADTTGDDPLKRLHRLDQCMMAMDAYLRGEAPQPHSGRRESRTADPADSAFEHVWAHTFKPCFHTVSDGASRAVARWLLHTVASPSPAHYQWIANHIPRHEILLKPLDAQTISEATATPPALSSKHLLNLWKSLLLSS